MERAMTEMKIDLDIIKGWVGKWEGDARSIRTASQVAAVMLGRALAENEARTVRVEKLLKEIISEINSLNRIEKKIVPSKGSSEGLQAELLEECKRHKRRMTGILREADELMKSSIESQSIRVGGLLLEIHRRRSCKESVPSQRSAAGSANEAREKIGFEKPVRA